jgi:hypothetical protein
MARSSVALQLHRGGVQWLAGKKNDDREAMRGSDDLALAERVRRAFAAYRLHAHREDPTPLLSRGRRSVADWIRDVAALASARGAGYRQASLDEGHLWRILRDASAPPSTRVGAAVALVSANEQDRPALKEAAAACANPRVRVALETVAASPEGQEWVGALDALTNDEEKRQA